MSRVWTVLALGVALGATMATGAGSWPARPGVVGLIAMVAIALAARGRWFGLDLAEPGSPERGLWIGMGCGAVLAGHLSTALYRIGPNAVMHTREMHGFGADSWMLVAGAVAAWAIARDPEPRRDERDAQIATLGLRWSHYTLVALLVGGLVPLGFDWTPTIRALSHAMIAHLLIVAILLCWIVDGVVRLCEYRRPLEVAE